MLQTVYSLSLASVAKTVLLQYALYVFFLNYISEKMTQPIDPRNLSTASNSATESVLPNPTEMQQLRSIVSAERERRKVSDGIL